MKTIMLATVLILLNFGISNAQKVPSTWAGTYEFEDSGMNATETRSFTSWAKLVITCEGGYCVGEYSDGENSDTYNKFSMTINGTADSITFNYLSCQTTERDGEEGCVNSYQEGDLMFKLVKGKPAKGKAKITTLWGKLQKMETNGEYFKKTGN